MKENIKQQLIFPMPRTAFVLLVLCVSLSVLPHCFRLPVWIMPLFVGSLFWRIQIFRQRLSFPPRWLRLGMVMLAFCGVVLHHGTIFGPDAGVGLLISAYVFKLLEMYTKRDAFLVVILSYFVLATEFLFSFSIYSTLYVLIVLIFITAALVALNQSDATIAVWNPVKKAGSLILQAVPLLIALSILFPRIGPVWQLNLSKSSPSVGLSDHVSPGDIAELSRSEKLAFRVEFKGKIPSRSDLYWRAVVFDRFDGRTWYAMDLKSQSPLRSDQLEKGGRTARYRMLLEPTGQNWLLAMPWADIEGLKHFKTESLMQYYKEPINSSLSYDVTSYPDYQYQVGYLSKADFHRLTSLPGGTDPQSRRYAKELFDRVNGNPEQFSNQLLRNYFTENFIYTLKPPRLGQNSIDDFLFNTRKGFCSHFASSYVFMMRSAGIPARMVGGYQGGVVHPLGGYLLVHQYDAHAWAEYWIEGRGWLRVDPTAAVAPNRIEIGPLNAESDASFLDESPLSPSKLRNMALIARVRILADYVDYLWVKNIVSYSKDAQSDLFAKLLGNVTPQRIALLMGGVGGVILLAMALVILADRGQKQRLDRTDRVIAKLINNLNKAGFKRQPEESLSGFLKRVQRSYPSQNEVLSDISHLYETIKYSNDKNITNFTRPELTPGDTLRSQRRALVNAIKRLKLKSTMD